MDHSTQQKKEKRKVKESRANLANPHLSLSLSLFSQPSLASLVSQLRAIPNSSGAAKTTVIHI